MSSGVDGWCREPPQDQRVMVGTYRAVPEACHAMRGPGSGRRTGVRGWLDGRVGGWRWWQGLAMRGGRVRRWAGEAGDGPGEGWSGLLRLRWAARGCS